MYIVRICARIRARACQQVPNNSQRELENDYWLHSNRNLTANITKLAPSYFHFKSKISTTFQGNM
jgi:hypothetical protein